MSNRRNATVSKEKYFIVDENKMRERTGVSMQIVQCLLNARKVVKPEGYYMFYVPKKHCDVPKRNRDYGVRHLGSRNMLSARPDVFVG